MNCNSNAYFNQTLQMLIRFKVENFRSIDASQELTLVASPLKELPGASIQIQGFSEKLLRVAALYGANASGKTNVLKAFNFVQTAVSDSHRKWSPDQKIERSPFRMSNADERPSTFEIEFFLDKVRYRYGFSLDSEQILEEWLYAYPEGKQQTWFTRDVRKPEKIFNFSRNLPGENKAVETLTRKNSLFLSAAAQNNHPLLLPIYNWFTNNMDYVRGPRMPFSVDESTAAFCKEHREILTRLLATADLGITSFRIDEEEPGEGFKKFAVFFKETFPSSEAIVPEKIAKLVLLHRGKNRDSVEFPLYDESTGTLAYFALLAPTVKALENGSLLFIDELDSSLHPLLAKEIVKLFNDPKLNPRGAQLIFNTHDTNLLDNSLLRRDQIWFTEKDQQGATHLYALSDFMPRKDENLKRGYLQGRYGAIPFIGELDFELKASM
jgi:uncharacterized protein